jgi:hypothetical protein
VHYVSHNQGRKDAQPGVAAVVWEDGLTYGPQELIQKLMARRRLSLLYHQHAIDLLETGLKEHWDANRFEAEGRLREEVLRVREIDIQLDIVTDFAAAFLDRILVRKGHPQMYCSSSLFTASSGM